MHRTDLYALLFLIPVVLLRLQPVPHYVEPPVIITDDPNAFPMLRQAP